MSDIPIIINNFNRLSTSKRLADDLSKLGYTNIHILDNNSTYPPLLEWYNECPYTVERCNYNHGQLALYNSDYINKFSDWVAYSDSDIELNQSTPRDFIEKLIATAEKYNRVKAGLALRIDDLPDSQYANYAKWIEEKFWKKELEKDVYDADIDTTFSVIKVGQPFQYQALRLAGDFTARHIPWYIEYSSSEFSTTKRFIDSVSLQKT